MSWFFFYYTGLPCALSSFPTRRSSDLYRRRFSLFGGEQAVDDFIGRGVHVHGQIEVRVVSPARRVSDFTRLPVDRKSTRLNSSHANISYAVFCLKKKRYFCIRSCSHGG